MLQQGHNDDVGGMDCRGEPQHGQFVLLPNPGVGLRGVLNEVGREFRRGKATRASLRTRQQNVDEGICEIQWLRFREICATRKGFRGSFKLSNNLIYI